MDPHSLEEVNKTIYLRSRWPELRPYENLEYDAQMYSRRRLPESEREELVPVTLEDNLDEDKGRYEEDPDYFRVFHYFRFFTVIEGFLKGNLDLTGRHETRLNELKPIWERFFTDFARLNNSACASLVHEEEEKACHLQSTLSYEVPKEEWKEFRLKWKIPRRIELNQAVRHTEWIRQLYVLHPDGPKIQKMCLLDLPTEVLDLMLSTASLKDARRLSATNKRLYQLGRQHTFKPFSWAQILPFPSKLTEDRESLILKARARFLEYSDFVQSQPDIMVRVNTLRFQNFARLLSETLDGSFTPHVLDSKTFFPPITSSLNKTISLAHNVGVLNLTHLDITRDLMQTLVQLVHLHSIRLSYSMQDDDLTHAIIGNELPLCGKVQFLELSSYSVDFRHPSDENTWLLLLLFPNILTFDYLSPPRNAIWSPPIPSLLSEDSAPSLATFKSLQKLFLSHYIDVPFVANSFRKLSAINSASFPLTHLKLHSCFGYFDSVIIDLLEALHSGSASLEVLILIGLQDADLVLFERITEFFPDILELSLDRRTGNRQTPPVQWPHPTWEYARYFARFTRLRHFSWNLLFLTTNLPRPMLVFERQAEIEHQLSIIHTPPLSRAELEEAFEDDAELLRLFKKAEKDTYDCFGWNTARLFSVHCPTLETFWDGCRSWFEVRISGQRLKDEFPSPRWDPMIPYRYDYSRV
ncbi:hypothetical protein BDP27DRAFT_1329748 [Rhodocollybia butyracea]|uniref:F-box domain-containing protein n=1 Tax=Rhodocollybia butyracea TaxID=206335 RepID=A0A9P5U5G9_9AGAR|nr:hypothetical protein BDP27DRAFT_1329748 [Rhodocollybia butyracea]